MTAVVKSRHFSAASKVFTGEADGLSAIIRGLAIDNARQALLVTNIAAITDSSTGTADGATSANDYTFADVPIAAYGVFVGTSSGAVQRSAFNTALGVVANAHAVLAERLNRMRGRLGLSMIVAPGTIATAGTIPAMTLTATTSSGTSAVDYASFLTGAATVKANHRKIVAAFMEVMYATGYASAFTVALTGAFGSGYTLAATPTIAAAATGASSIKLSNGNDFLAGLANNVATMALAYNALFTQTGLTALTDSSGGTASLTTIAALGTFTPYTTAGTDLAPKTTFDTQLGLYADAFADLAARINLVSTQLGLGTLVTDSSGGSANTTIAALASALTAVDGTGNTGVAAVSGLAKWVLVKNGIATLTAAVNELAPFYGVSALTDSSGGTASTANPKVIAAVGTTSAGSDGTSLGSVADTEVDANLLAAKNAIATLALAVNKMLGTDDQFRPLMVVAGAF